MTTLVWQMREALDSHSYDITSRGSRPDDPGWHECRCHEWEGYWIDYNDHVARAVLDELEVRGVLDASGSIPKSTALLTIAEEDAAVEAIGRVFGWQSLVSATRHFSPTQHDVILHAIARAALLANRKKAP